MGINTGVNIEISDNEGSTVVYSGTATTTPTLVPASPNKAISGLLADNLGNVDLQVSMDGGSTYKTISRGGFFAWDVKGSITQVYVKTASSTTTYEIVFNFEE